MISSIYYGGKINKKVKYITSSKQKNLIELSKKYEKIQKSEM